MSDKKKEVKPLAEIHLVVYPPVDGKYSQDVKIVGRGPEVESLMMDAVVHIAEGSGQDEIEILERWAKIMKEVNEVD